MEVTRPNMVLGQFSLRLVREQVDLWCFTVSHEEGVGKLPYLLVKELAKKVFKESIALLKQDLAFDVTLATAGEIRILHDHGVVGSSTRQCALIRVDKAAKLLRARNKHAESKALTASVRAHMCSQNGVLVDVDEDTLTNVAHVPDAVGTLATLSDPEWAQLIQSEDDDSENEESDVEEGERGVRLRGIPTDRGLRVRERTQTGRQASFEPIETPKKTVTGKRSRQVPLKLLDGVEEPQRKHRLPRAASLANTLPSPKPLRLGDQFHSTARSILELSQKKGMLPSHNSTRRYIERTRRRDPALENDKLKDDHPSAELHQSTVALVDALAAFEEGARQDESEDKRRTRGGRTRQGRSKQDEKEEQVSDSSKDDGKRKRGRPKQYSSRAKRRATSEGAKEGSGESDGVGNSDEEDMSEMDEEPQTTGKRRPRTNGDGNRPLDEEMASSMLVLAQTAAESLPPTEKPRRFRRRGKCPLPDVIQNIHGIDVGDAIVFGLWRETFPDTLLFAVQDLRKLLDINKKIPAKFEGNVINERLWLNQHMKKLRLFKMDAARDEIIALKANKVLPRNTPKASLLTAEQGARLLNCFSLPNQATVLAQQSQLCAATHPVPDQSGHLLYPFEQGQYGSSFDYGSAVPGFTQLEPLPLMQQPQPNYGMNSFAAQVMAAANMVPTLTPIQLLTSPDWHMPSSPTDSPLTSQQRTKQFAQGDLPDAEQRPASSSSPLNSHQSSAPLELAPALPIRTASPLPLAPALNISALTTRHASARSSERANG